MHQKEPITF